MEQLLQMTGATLMLVAAIALLLIIGATIQGRKRHAPPTIETSPPPESNPGLSIHGPKDRAVQCQICLGRIKIGQGYAVCRCGKEFHRPCVERTGYCPYCDKEYSRKEFRRRYNLPEDAQVTLRRCPVCADFLPRETMLCDCGAVFLAKDGSFRCPSCGVTVPGGESECPSCGDRFKEYDAVHCPHCRSLVPEGDNVCECGTVIDDKCPDCGWQLKRDEDRCPICGLVFEFVRG